MVTKKSSSRKSTSKKTHKKAPKKVVEKTTKASPKKASNKSTKKTMSSKTHKKVAPKATTKTHKKVDSKTSNKKDSRKKDIYTIIALSIVVIAIVLVSFLVPQDTNTDNTDIIDQTEDINYNTDTQTNQETTNSDRDMQDIQEDAQLIQEKIFSETIAAQKAILEEYYSELNLNSEEIEACLLENDIVNLTQESFENPILSKISADTMLAQEVGINGTPGIYINGFKLEGYNDFNTIEKYIDFAKDTQVNLNYDNNGYSSNITEPTLKFVYNSKVNSQEDIDLFFEYLETSDNLTENVKSFFVDLFNEVNIEYTNYKDSIELIETTNTKYLPAMYLEGNIDDTIILDDENNHEIFNLLFEETNNLYKSNENVMTQLVSQGNYSSLVQLLDLNKLSNENDYVIGDKDLNTTMYVFTDYDCPYCKMFEEEVQIKYIEEYVDTNKANLVIKDFVVHMDSALFPAVFSRCAQEQGVYLETHEKLFALQDQIGANGVVKDIQDKYEAEITDLQEEYQTFLENNPEYMEQLQQQMSQQYS